MAKVTSKLQVTIPKAVADQYGIRPGDRIDFVPAGEAIHVVREGAAAAARVDTEWRLEVFDRATGRIERRRKAWRGKAVRDRGWKREDLYERGRPR
ncbi:MAG: AbrB/MazE/SpoVT family DNA-binding domain-containing protein [Planctomycetes bacterium]|jgi:AbrB family looped-hinge helix DNA binding protein|nr:AbrB/MazE/SpoVT family DNA-binding domain-containing protein [Planctomycetota bacterium]